MPNGSSIIIKMFISIIYRNFNSFIICTQSIKSYFTIYWRI